MVNSNLTAIESKIRRITKSPSQNQITSAQILEYINTYFLYDFPQELRLKNCLSNFKFATVPNQENYVLPTDTIITIEPPVYVNGYQCYFTQDQGNFYRLYPRLAVPTTGPSGNGTAGPYTFTLSPAPVVQGQVVVSLIDNATGSSIAVATDNPSKPVSNTGTLTGNGVASGSTINYLTGAISITFTSLVPNTESILAQSVPYNASRPVSVLFYNDIISLRPIPDQCYMVEIQAFVNPLVALTGQTTNPPTLNATPDEMLPSPPNVATVPIGFNNVSDTAQLKQWWQLIAWGASMKIFEDRGDLENIARFSPLYDQQKRLVLRRTLVEMANERAATIYTDQLAPGQFGYFNQF